MRKLGLSTQKTAYIRDLARHTRDRRLAFEDLTRLSDAEVIERVTQVKGIGVWTAHMFLIFALRRHDVLPTGDLGVRNAIRRAYGLPALPSPAEMEKLAERWRPYCSVASWYLWRSLESDANL
jgi:DNA-3-methyladenine glycosylase II